MLQKNQENPLLRWGSRLLSLIRGYFLAVGLLTTALCALLIYVALQSGPRKEALASDAKVVLHLTFDGTALEKSHELGFWQEALSQLTGKKTGIDVWELRREFHNIAEDARVRGILVEIQHLDGSQAAIEELREAFSLLIEAKKVLHFWSPNWNSKTLHLASIGSVISVPPLGEVRLGEPLFQPIYFAEALRKLGIEMEVVRVGKYKSAVEPYLSNTMSPEAKEMYERLQKDFHTHWITRLSHARNKSADQVREWIEQGLWGSQQAKEKGLLDQIQYFSQSKDAILALTETTWLSYEKYGLEIPTIHEDIGHHDGDVGSTQTEPGIAWLDAVGEIRMARNGMEEGVITPEDMEEQFRWAREKAEVRAVILRISSPGGEAQAGDLIWKEAMALAEKKPLIISMGGMAASAAYYIASAGTYLIAQPTTLTGSIGVFGMKPSAAAFESKYGISFPVAGGSRNDGIYRIGSPMSPEERQRMQALVDTTYAKFLECVANNRKWTKEKVNELGQGYVWTGIGAKEVGLVDELGGIQVAWKKAVELSGLDKTKGPVPMHRWTPSYDSLQSCLQKAHSWHECFPLKKMGAALTQPSESKVTQTLQEMESRLLRMQVAPVQAIAPFALPGLF